MKPNKGNLLIVLLTILVLLLGIDLTTRYTSNNDNNQLPTFSLKENPLNTAGYIQIKTEVFDSGIVLYEGCQGFIMTTNILQTNSIVNGIENRVEMRPTIHDISKEIFDQFAINVRMIKIEKLERGTYYAELYLEDDNKLVNIDIKPSDAIALAVRFDAPIYVNEKLFNEVGQNIC